MDQNPTKILLTCLGYASEALRAERLAQVCAEEWQDVVELAWHQEVAPMLYHRLKQMDISIPGELAAKLRQGYWKNTRRNMHLYQELGKLLQRLNDKNIAVIALKGVHLAEAVYETIGMRIMIDIDLLVREENLPQVEQVLLATGYIPNEFSRIITQYNKDFSYRIPKRNINIEIHWSLVDPEYPIRFDMEALWNRATPITLTQVPSSGLSPADLLIYLCFHTAKHTYDMQLKMLCDIGEVVTHYEEELDWTEIAVRAQQWGILHAVYVMLRLAQEMLEVPTPRDWLASIKPVSFDDHYLALAREQILVDQYYPERVILQSPSTAKFWGLKGLGSKFKVLRKRLFLSREDMALAYPIPANSWRIYLYYLVRLREIIMRQKDTLWSLARRDSQKQTALIRTNQVTELHDWLMSK